MKQISIIIPAYNEESRISETLDSYINYFNKNQKNKFEIIVIPNGCKDKTIDIVKEYRKKYNFVRFKEIKAAMGKGRAIIKGLEIANSPILGFVDADNSTEPEEFDKLIKELKKTDADCVIASRWIKGAQMKPKQPLARRIASRCFNFLVKMLFGIKVKDTQCGSKIFRKKPLKEIIPLLKTSRWAFDVDILYNLRKKKRKVFEYPIIWKNKTGSNLRIKKQGPEMFFEIVKLRMIHSPFKFIIKFYNKSKTSNRGK